MKRVKQAMNKVFSFCMVVILVLGMAVIPAEKTNAANVNEQIQNAKNAVVQVMVCVKDPYGNWTNLVAGTGFLVGTEANAQYVITNDHVAHATSTEWLNDDIAKGMQTISQQTEYTKIKTKVRVVLKRDSYIDASIVQSSSDADLAILKLEQPIYNRAPIVLNATTEPQSTEKVYALGFPGLVQSYQDDKIYTSDDVTVTDGSVSKVAASSVPTGSPITYINHSAAISEGNSGGPLLNEEGEVIGVNEWGSTTGDTSYYYSIQIKEVTDLLDAMGIDYMKSGDSVAEADGDNTDAASDSETETTAVTESASAVDELLDKLGTSISEAKAVDTASYTKDSAQALTDAITAAEDTQKLGNMATEEELQKAIDALADAKMGLEEQTGSSLPMGVIILIVAVVVVALIIIIVVVMNNNKKKEEAARKESQARKIAGGAGGFQQNAGFTPRDTSSYGGDDGSTPTGVLNEGSSATTVLSNANMPNATLIRKKTNERITVNKAEFKIGKERRKVDYCISDNTSISRLHATIIYRNGSFYIVDNNATNGTSVNGSSLAANTEKALAGNETIRLADEEFIFRC